MVDESIKSKILKSLLDTIRTIADEEYQEQVWIKKLATLSDFDETMCHFFDDCSSDDIINYPKKYGITPAQHNKLIKLYNALRTYSDDSAGIESEVMQDPEWHKIRSIAKEVLIEFNYPNATRIVDNKKFYKL